MPKSLRIDHVLEELDKLYDPPTSFLNWETPLDLLIATLLSAQCTDAVVNRVTEKLFRDVRTPQDYLKLSRQELETRIRSCGTYRNKAKHIHELCDILVSDFDSQVPDAMDELTLLPGVGRKTAAIVLWAAFGKTEGIAVDTHVMRLAKRLGLSRKKTQRGIELDLIEKTPRDRWGDVNTLLISHGRAVCTAKSPKCDKCVFGHECPSSALLKKRKSA